MNWEAIGAISEMVGVLAVIVTLFYLANQIKQNTDALNTEARNATREGGHAELFTMVGNPDIVLSIVKVEPPSEREQAVLSAFLFAVMRTREFAWGQFKDGAIDASQWETEENVILFVLDSTRTREWWTRLGQNVYSVEFTAFVNSLLDLNPPTNTQWQGYTSWNQESKIGPPGA